MRRYDYLPFVARPKLVISVMNSTSPDEGPSPAEVIYLNKLTFRGFAVTTMAIGEHVLAHPHASGLTPRTSGVYACMALISLHLLVAQHQRSRSRMITICFTLSMFCVTMSW
jgi:hypothetical protein